MLNKFRKVKSLLTQKSQTILFAGNTVLCLLCGWQGSKFMPNSRCPQCQSMARHRLIPYTIYHFGLNYDSCGLLHVGPNIQEITFILNRFLPTPYYRLDIQSRPGINLQGDLCDIPLDDNSIDFVLIWHVLEHIPEDRLAMKELYRILAPQGKALVSVPITPPGREVTFEDQAIPRERYRAVYGHPDHVRACGLDYAERLPEVGFRVDTLSVKDVAQSDKLFFGLSDNHVVWCCTK